MASRALLIFGGLDDAHVRFPERILRHNGFACFFYDPLRLMSVTMSPTEESKKPSLIVERIVSDDGKESIFREKLEIPYSSPVVWLRNKKFVDFIESERDQWAYISSREHTEFIKTLVRMYELKCINELHSIILVRHKANQIRIARDSGFRVPPTLLSSDREEIINFCNRYKNIIVKPISTNFVPPPIDGRANFVTIMTNSVTLQEILQTDEEAFAAAPAIYQKRIEKAYEIRLVAFGEEAVAYKIDSQRSEAGALDWRRAQYEDIYEWTEATPEMRRLSARFLRHAGLHYGVFDLVVDCNNKLWFLECNADGQWAWLEPQGDGPIARMFARQIQKLLGNP